MKTLTMIGLILLVAQLSWAQRVNRDPSYSMNNYKHPNKAAYARVHNLDKATQLNQATVERNDNYKQPYSHASKTEKFAIQQAPKNTERSSYKHPYGL